MRALLTKRQMSTLDRIAIEDVGIPAAVLMEIAGIGVADAAEAALNARGGGAIVSVAGLGNNGGDAVVAARHLFGRGHPITLVLAGDPEKASPDLKAQLAIAEKLGLEPNVVSAETPEDALVALLDGYAVAIDGLFGTGLSRDVEGVAKAIIEALNAIDVTVVAVDIPSGIDADTGQVLGTAVLAETTVTFQHPKLGHVLFPGREHAGELVIVDIGIPPMLLAEVEPRAVLIEEDVVAEALPARRADTHKGTYGHLLVVAGAPEKPGSALLVARAALRTGAGLVTVASDDETIRRLGPALVELMGLSLGAKLDADAILAALETRSALAIGPSLAPGEVTKALVLDVLLHATVPAVVDAGALAALGTDVTRLAIRKATTVLTPHPGEMARLAGVDAATVQADRPTVARRVAETSGCFVVLKGASTVVASPSGEVGVLVAGNPGMATGGTGDVLGGIIGSLLAQRVPGELAARAGVRLHADAGDRAAQSGEARLIASDIIAHLLVGSPS